MNRPTGGGAATAQQLAYARAVAAAHAAQLANVRAAAGRWQGGLAGLSGTIAVFGLVQGADDVDRLASGWGVAYGVCLAIALGCSVGGGVLAMRAAFGLPKVISTSMDAGRSGTDAEEARRSAGLLHPAIWLTVVAIVFVAATLGVAWYAPREEEAKLRIRQPTGAEDCGTVVSVDNGKLVLNTDTGRRTVRLDTADGVAAVDSCSDGG